MKSIILMLFVAFILTGCSMCLPLPYKQVDRDKQNKIFMECLDKMKDIKGPESTVYNDWDDVIFQCNSSAYYQSSSTRFLCS